MDKKPGLNFTDNEKLLMYKALNISLTNHNDTQVKMQKKYYAALKKQGYSGLLDINDRKYSSYHANSPVIIFDYNKVKMQSVMNMDHTQISQLYKEYNPIRLKKDIPEKTIGWARTYGQIKLGQVEDFVNSKVDKYLK